MKLEDVDWVDYYDKVDDRPPRPLLRSTLELFKLEPTSASRLAIDLGSGDGTDSVYLLENDWQVLAIDGEAKAIDRLQAKVPEELKSNLQTQIAQFEKATLPSADLIHASLTLPFCHPTDFGELWQKIVVSLGVNGRFAGHFFGVNDDWADNSHMTFHTRAEVKTLLAPFEIEHFHEKDETGMANGPKHWHIFTVIARKLG